MGDTKEDAIKYSYVDVQWMLAERQDFFMALMQSQTYKAVVAALEKQIVSQLIFRHG